MEKVGWTHIIRKSALLEDDVIGLEGNQIASRSLYYYTLYWEFIIYSKRELDIRMGYLRPFLVQ